MDNFPRHKHFCMFGEQVVEIFLVGKATEYWPLTCVVACCISFLEKREGS